MSHSTTQANTLRLLTFQDRLMRAHYQAQDAQDVEEHLRPIGEGIMGLYLWLREMDIEVESGRAEEGFGADQVSEFTLTLVNLLSELSSQWERARAGNEHVDPLPAEWARAFDVLKASLMDDELWLASPDIKSRCNEALAADPTTLPPFPT